MPRFASVYIHDTDHAPLNRKKFKGKLSGRPFMSFFGHAASEQQVDKSFTSLRDLIESKKVPDDVNLVIFAHDRRQCEYNCKYNSPQSSEVAALIISEQYVKVVVVFGRHS